MGSSCIGFQTKVMARSSSSTQHRSRIIPTPPPLLPSSTLPQTATPSPFLRACRSRYRTHRLTCMSLMLAIGLLTTAIHLMPSSRNKDMPTADDTEMPLTVTGTGVQVHEDKRQQTDVANVNRAVIADKPFVEPAAYTALGVKASSATGNGDVANINRGVIADKPFVEPAAYTALGVKASSAAGNGDVANINRGVIANKPFVEPAAYTALAVNASSATMDIAERHGMTGVPPQVAAAAVPAARPHATLFGTGTQLTGIAHAVVSRDDDETGTGAIPTPSKAATPSTDTLANLEYATPQRTQLIEPAECHLWRRIARQPEKLRLYRQHFNNHDEIDWFLYAAIYTEAWHTKLQTTMPSQKKKQQMRRRPVYLDVAANHARRWSATWFFDRCLGWAGICAEPNEAYWTELRQQRSCHLVNTCLSDREHAVNFSFSAAYGGVVKTEEEASTTGHSSSSSSSSVEKYGVNGSMHATHAKFEQHHTGIREITCTTLQRVLRDRQKATTGSKEDKTHVDFMSLDVEGHEYPILQGINWNETTIDVIVTENRGPEVKALLQREGYDSFPKILKDAIWIRRGSGIVMDPVVVKWMASFNRQTKTFGEDVVAAAEQATVDGKEKQAVAAAAAAALL